MTDLIKLKYKYTDNLTGHLEIYDDVNTIIYSCKIMLNYNKALLEFKFNN